MNILRKFCLAVNPYFIGRWIGYVSGNPEFINLNGTLCLIWLVAAIVFVACSISGVGNNTAGGKNAD